MSSLHPAPLLSFLLLVLLCHLTVTPTSTAASFSYDLFRRLPAVVGSCQGRADWKETPEGHVISVDVPWMSRDELRIDVDENRVVTVSGERKLEEKKKGERWHKTQRPYGAFRAQFGIPENADLDTVEAQLKDGVLAVTISKLSPDKIVRPRTVGIAGGVQQQEL